MTRCLPPGIGMPIFDSLKRFSFNSTNEDAVQKAIADVLTEAKIPFKREYVLSARDRVDFFFEDGGCLEIKTKGSLNDVRRQLFRYAEHDEVTWVGLATTISRLRVMPETMCGKPLRVFQLTWGSL